MVEKVRKCEVKLTYYYKLLITLHDVKRKENLNYDVSTLFHTKGVYIFICMFCSFDKTSNNLSSTSK